jgi:uncharacterized protein YjbI with pentapeptide repeats
MEAVARKLLRDRNTYSPYWGPHRDILINQYERGAQLDHSKWVDVKFLPEHQDDQPVPVDFTGVHLEDSRFRKQTLFLVTLNDAYLNRSRWSSGKFIRVECEDAHFDEARLVSVEFVNSSLDNSEFNGAELEACDFKRLGSRPLTGIKFIGAAIGSCDFDELSLVLCQFDRADIDACSMVGVTFDSCRFPMASLATCKLDRSKFINCDLSYTNFSFARLVEAEVKHTRGPKLGNLRCTTFHRADLRGAHFENLDLTGVNFQMADLSEARFVNCRVLAADFRQATIGQDTFDSDCTILGSTVSSVNTTGLQWLHDRSLVDTPPGETGTTIGDAERGTGDGRRQASGT